MFLASQMTAEYQPTTVIPSKIYLDIAKTALQTAKSIEYINSHDYIRIAMLLPKTYKCKH